MLFEEKLRTGIEPASHSESNFDYYDRSARKDISKIRVLLNEWFVNYPEHERSELKSRFKKTFTSAFYELFLYNLFKYQDFEIIIHPVIENSNKHPDFLIKKDGYEFYIEAKEARDKTQSEEAIENKMNQFYDSLDKIKSENFLLRINEVLLKSNKQPSTKKIIEKIELEVAKHDPDVVYEQLMKHGLEAGINFLHEDDDVKLQISLLPKIPSGRHINDKAIGMFPYESFWGGSEDSIKTSFTKKAKRYGTLDKPYFICINAIGIKGSGEYDAYSAIWGTLACTFSTDPNNRDERLEFNRDGIFLSKTGPRCRNVSGVLVTKVREYDFPSAPFWFAKHPYSENEANFDVFNLTHLYVEEGRIMTRKKSTIGEIFNLNDK